jgi:peptidoglycan/LPS O-acetylase OafA/YrhL
MSVNRAFPLLDGYRAMAALMVLTTHVAFSSGEILTPYIGPFLGRLDFGVTLFFLLSGFLLYRPWARAAMTARPGPSLRIYSLRRAVRILPAYWAMAVVALVVIGTLQPLPWQAWAVHLGLAHVYVPGFIFEGLTQTWSLATEVAFYAVLPLLAWLAGRGGRGRPTVSARYQLIVLGLASLGAWVFLATRAFHGEALSPLSIFWLPGFLDWFALGMAAAVIQVRLTLPQAPPWMQATRRIAMATGGCLAGAALLGLIAMTPVAGPITLAPASPASALIKHALYGLIAVLLLMPGFLGIGDASRPHPGRSWWGRLMSSSACVYLGTISYGIFLWHMVLIVLIQRLLGLPPFSGQFLLLWALVVIASIGMASASWYVLESPLIRWSRRVTSGGSHAPPSADAAPAGDSSPPAHGGREPT